MVFGALDPVSMAVLSAVVVSLISFLGLLTLVLKDVMLKRVVLYFVGFSAGALMGDAFIHLIPQIIETAGFGMRVSLFILLGVVISFSIEKIIYWRHSHMRPSEDRPKTFAYMNLFADGVHNFIDGLIIAASYLVSVPVGVATTVAVIFHEIPQEISDFGVLIHGGFTKKKALFLNFILALAAVAGVGAALLLSSYLEQSTTYMAAFAAGSFIYIAGSDLIPELHKKFTIKSSIIQILTIILGIAVMYALLLLE